VNQNVGRHPDSEFAPKSLALSKLSAVLNSGSTSGTPYAILTCFFNFLS
jgi:hypothetical protein